NFVFGNCHVFRSGFLPFRPPPQRIRWAGGRTNPPQRLNGIIVLFLLPVWFRALPSLQYVVQLAQSFSQHFYFFSGAVHNGGSHIVAVASIDDHIDQVFVLFIDQFRVGAVLDHIIVVLDGGGQDRLP